MNIITKAIALTLRSLGLDPKLPSADIIRALRTTPGGNPRKILGTSTKIEKNT